LKLKQVLCLFSWKYFQFSGKNLGNLVSLAESHPGEQALKMDNMKVRVYYTCTIKLFNGIRVIIYMYFIYL